MNGDNVSEAVNQSVSVSKSGSCCIYGSPYILFSLKECALIGSAALRDLRSRASLSSYWRKEYLAPCPRCEARPVLVGEEHGPNFIAWVRCEKCWNYKAGDCISGPCVTAKESGVIGDLEFDESGPGWQKIKQTALAAWNMWIAAGMPHANNLGHPWPWKDEGITMADWMIPRLKILAAKQRDGEHVG